MIDHFYSPEEQRNRKIASDCFKRATEAMAKQNWGYSVEMFHACVKMVPDNLMYRQSLRGCERKKYKDKKTGALTTYVLIPSIRSKIEKARAAKNWRNMDLAAEEGLKIDPWDRQFNADLAEAARELGYLEIAKFADEEANRPDDDPNEER